MSTNPSVEVSLRHVTRRLILGRGHHAVTIEFKGTHDDPCVTVTSSSSERGVHVAPRELYENLYGYEPSQDFDTMTRVLAAVGLTVVELPRHASSVSVKLHVGHASIYITIGTYRPERDYYANPSSRGDDIRRHDRSRSRERDCSIVPETPAPAPPPSASAMVLALPAPPVIVTSPLEYVPLDAYNTALKPVRKQIELLHQLLKMKGIQIPKMPTPDIPWWTLAEHIKTAEKTHQDYISVLSAALVAPSSPTGAATHPTLQ